MMTDNEPDTRAIDYTPPELRPVRHPVPGPAQVRPIWDGEEEVRPVVYTPPPEPDPTPSRWTKNGAFGSAGNGRRLLGLDAARGLALLGMIAVHTLPAYNDVTDQPTLIWRLFAGHAAVLFGVLAGVAVALMTGSNNPHTGRRLRRDQVGLVVRALIILVLGLGLDGLGLPVYNILAYYGLMFLFSVPLARLRIRTLLVLAAVFAFVGPVVIHLVNSWGGYTTTVNPDFADLGSWPGDTLLTLLVGGTYPAVTWMTYLCLGLAVGRLNLRWLVTQVRLTAAGIVLAAAAFLTSTFLTDYAGGFRQLFEATAGYDPDDIQDVLDYGPDDRLPTDTWWWLTISGPHTNTTLSVLASAGLAVAAIGGFLILARVLGGWLAPLTAAGSMTLTLYVAHMLFLRAVDGSGINPTVSFLLQVVAAVLFGLAWHLARGKGPLEDIVGRICRSVSRLVVPDLDSTGSTGSRHRTDPTKAH